MLLRGNGSWVLRAHCFHFKFTMETPIFAFVGDSGCMALEFKSILARDGEMRSIGMAGNFARHSGPSMNYQVELAIVPQAGWMGHRIGNARHRLPC